MTRKGKDPAFLFYSERWLADLDVQCMSLAAQGAYVRLLAHQHLDGSVPSDPGKLSRLLGVASDEALAIWEEVGPKFPGGVNKTLRGVMLERNDLSRKRAVSGRLGGLAKAKQAASKSQAKPWPSVVSSSSGKDSPPHAKNARGGAASNGKVKEPKQHPETERLCELLAKGILRWMPEARITVHSTASRMGMHRLLKTDAREPRAIAAMIQWLFAAYEPSGDFDWRPNVMSGGALRRQWDKLTAQKERGGGLAEETFSGR